MKHFAAPSLVIEAPEDWTDATTYIMAGPPAGDTRPTLVVAIARHVAESSLAAYVDRQIPDLKKLLNKFSLERRTPTNIKTFDAIIVEFKWKQPAGPMLRQRQYYIWVSGNVYTITATVPDAAFPAWSDIFDAMLDTFKPKKW